VKACEDNDMLLISVDETWPLQFTMWSGTCPHTCLCWGLSHVL